jgi:hypothetical protein
MDVPGARPPSIARKTPLRTAATTFIDSSGIMVPQCPRGWSPLREHEWQIRIPTIGQKSTVRMLWEIEVPSQQYRNRSTGTDYRLLFSIQFPSALHEESHRRQNTVFWTNDQAIIAEFLGVSTERDILHLKSSALAGQIDLTSRMGASSSE